jgi:hypothetical protein
MVDTALEAGITVTAAAIERVLLHRTSWPTINRDTYNPDDYEGTDDESSDDESSDDESSDDEDMEAQRRRDLNNRTGYVFIGMFLYCT